MFLTLLLAHPFSLFDPNGVLWGQHKRVDARFILQMRMLREDGPASQSQQVVMLATELVSLSGCPSENSIKPGYFLKRFFKTLKP